MPFILTLTKNSSNLSSLIYPPVVLDDGKYEIGLMSLDTYNSIPNIDFSNNVFYFGESDFCFIPEGTYDVEAIFKYLQKQVHARGHGFTYETNLNTFRTSIKCSVYIDFSKPNSVGPILGFHKRILEPNTKHFSDFVVNIFRVNLIDVQCNIANGSYTNGVPSHSIYAFSPKVAPGFKIHEVPNDVIYFPVNVNQLNDIEVTIVDQNGNMIDFRKERITVRLHIRKTLS